MPLQCTLGTERRPDTPDWVWLASAFVMQVIAARFARIGAFLGFLIPDDALYSADDLCAEEPVVPDFPAIEQWAGAINKQPGDVVIVWEYVKAIVWQFFWEGHCQCVGLTGCPHYANSFNYTWGAGTTPLVTPNLGTVNVPPGATGFTTVYTAYSHTGSQTAVNMRYTCRTEAGATTLMAGHALNSQSVPYTAAAITLTAGCKYLDIGFGRAGSNAGFQSAAFDNQFTGPCSDDRPGEWEPLPAEDPVGIEDYPIVSCTTIGDLCTKLTRIEAILRFTDRSVAWLQTSLAPDSWVPGTPHTGLSGSGSFAVSDTLGLFVTATVPPTWGMTYENPPRLIGAIGSIQWSIDGVPMDSVLIHYDEQHVFGAPPATDEIIYNFKPGVVGSVTPLQRLK